MWVGIGVLASNFIAAAWGAVAWLRKEPRGAIVFWPLIRIAQGTVVLQAVVGGLLLASGERAPDGLHAIYGIAPLLITFVTEGMRAGVAQRELDGVEDVEALDRAGKVALARRVALNEMGVMTVGALLILTLALRAYQTGG
jgi:hypothetical protein